MPWYPDEYLAPAGPSRQNLNANLNYLKTAVDNLAGATAPVGTLAELGASGAGSGYVMDGVYAKQSDGTWLWQPSRSRGMHVESSVAPASLSWTITDGLSRVITKANWLFVLTGSGTATIVLGNRFTNTATIGGNTVSENVFYGFQIPSGLTITFSADTGITLLGSNGSATATIVQAGPARVWFAHGAATWRQL